MKKFAIILLLGISGCIGAETQDGGIGATNKGAATLRRPDFSQPRPVKEVAPVKTATEVHSFSVVDTEHSYTTVLDGRTYLVVKVTHFQDLGPVQSGSKK
jgi:hypothetical protein